MVVVALAVVFALSFVFFSHIGPLSDWQEAEHAWPSFVLMLVG